VVELYRDTPSGTHSALHRPHSFEDAEAEYEGLFKSYKANRYEIVLIPKGTPAERANFFEEKLGL
jgi:predicted ATPase